MAAFLSLHNNNFSSLTSDETIQLITSTLTAEVIRLKSESGQAELKVRDVNNALASLRIRLKEYFKMHMPNATWREIKSIRSQIYAASGINNGRPLTFSGMTLQEVLDYMEENKINSIRALPSALNVWISSQPGWKNHIIKVLPMKAYWISENGLICRSKYELITANLLTALMPEGLGITCQVPYPFHKTFNCAIKTMSCDFIVHVGNEVIWIELFMFRADSNMAGSGLGDSRPRYLIRRQQKIDLFNTQIPGDRLISIEVSAATGQAKSFRKFIKDVLLLLNPILHLKEFDTNNNILFNSFMARFCTEHSPMSYANQMLTTSLLRKASASYRISQKKLKRIHDLMVSGLSAKVALANQSIASNTFLGLSRSTGRAHWNLALTHPLILKKQISDQKLGKGSSLLSFAKAINHLMLANTHNSIH
jgi:hypothetical protein